MVNQVRYGPGKIEYSTFDAPVGTSEVLRLAFTPRAVLADGLPLVQLPELTKNGYTVKSLGHGDTIVTIRHDGKTGMVVTGLDPQQVLDDDRLTYEGQWTVLRDPADWGGACHVSAKNGAVLSVKFLGSQVRLIGRADAQGGLAEVYLDGVKRLAGIDCWSPFPQHQQVLFAVSGLGAGHHQLRIVVRGTGNARSKGANIYIDAIQWSDATGETGFGEGGGPGTTQRLLFGYTGRRDYVDTAGHAWKPGCEFVVPSGPMTDSVAASWWTSPIKEPIAGTADPELYRYGIHAPQFVVNLTVGPGTYHVRLKFAARQGLDPKRNCLTLVVNGREMVRSMDVAATAGGVHRAVDLVFNRVQPHQGVIELRFQGGLPQKEGPGRSGEAFVQAIEVGPGDGGQGAIPVR